MKNRFCFLLLLFGSATAFQTRFSPRHARRLFDSRTKISPFSMGAEEVVLNALSEDNVAPWGKASSIVSQSQVLLHNPILSSPVFWTTTVLLTVVGLLIAWDTLVERAKEATPPAIATVINNILMEMGSLGFIGLVLSAALNNPVLPLQTAVKHLSQEYLHDPELLLESFHFLHELFFQAAIVYFFGSAFMTQRVIDSIEFASDLAERNVIRHKKQITGDETLAEQDLAMEDYEDMLCQHEEARKHESDNIFLRELFMPMDERGTEALVIRERIQKQVLHLPEWFRLDKDLEEAFATEELNLIKISPWTWLPLVPVLALAASVDLAHDVANPGAMEAVASSGYFLATPGVFFPLLALQLLKLGWGLFNFWKMATIKDMLIPRITRMQLPAPHNGTYHYWQVMPPAGECASEQSEFSSTTWFAQPIESLFAQPATNRVQELFGTVGGNGVDFYFESNKLHTWLCVATLVAFAFQIVPRDLFALLSGVEGVGLPDLLGPELLIQSSYAIMNLLFLLVISPVTFMNFAIILCVERAVATHTTATTTISEQQQQQQQDVSVLVADSSTATPDSPGNLTLAFGYPRNVTFSAASP